VYLKHKKGGGKKPQKEGKRGKEIKRRKQIMNEKSIAD